MSRNVKHEGSEDNAAFNTCVKTVTWLAEVKERKMLTRSPKTVKIGWVRSAWQVLAIL